VKARVPPDIKGNGKDQNEAGDKDNFEKQRGLPKEETHEIFSEMLNYLKGISTIYTFLTSKNQ
jgi:hypothetical protein